MLLTTQVGWLGGYPLENRAVGDRLAWQGSKVDAVDRARLAATQRALHELHRDFADVLPTLVGGDVAGWDAAVAHALTALKRALHDHLVLVPPWDAYPLPLRAVAAQLANSSPALKRLLAAVAWHRLGRPCAVADDLAWLAAQRDAAAAIAMMPEGVTLLLAVLDGIAADGVERTAPLVALLADRSLAKVITSPGEYLPTMITRLSSRSVKLIERPKALGDGLDQLVAWIVVQPARVRRKALRILALIDLPELIGRWRRWWTDVDALVVQGWRGHRRGGIEGQHAVADALSKLKALRDVRLHALPPGNGCETLRELIVHATSIELDVAVQLSRLDTTRHPLSILLSLNLRLGPNSGCSATMRSGQAAVIAGMHALQSSTGLTSWLEPMLALLDGYDAWQLDHLLPRLSDWLRLRDTLIAAARAAVVIKRDELAWVAAIVSASASAEDAVARLAALGETREISTLQQAVLATWLSEDPDVALAARASTFAVLHQQLKDHTAFDDDTHPTLCDVITLVRQVAPHARGVLRTLLEVAPKQLVDAARMWRAAVALGVHTPRLELPARCLPAWAQQWPASLHPALALADSIGLVDAAQAKIAAVFGDPSALATELAVIETLLGADTTLDADQRLALLQRRTNLAARIACPKPPRPERIAKLAARLGRMVHLAIFEAWTTELVATVATALTPVASAAALPLLLDPRHKPLLPGFAELRSADRALARRVLTARAGTAPWDLRDEPANRAYLDLLAARGIDSAPWLEGIGEHHAGDLVLALEPDPLEILHMGRHFHTCLSPWAENFYSTVVNAADINKRVVYGRRGAANGPIVGRCLLALTDEGTLVTFTPYEHHPGFTPAVRAFVVELATRMGTTIVPGGSVSTLLHDRWYDDGVRDLTHRFAFLAPGSQFRQRLMECALDDLVPMLTQYFAPLPLGTYVLGLFLNLDELEARPELVIPLAPLIARVEGLPVATQLHAAKWLEQSGHAELVDVRLGEVLARAVRQMWRQSGWVPVEYLLRLSMLGPSRTLALLRELRCRRGQLMNPQLRFTHAWVTASALELLHRPRQALDHYYRALTDASGAERDHCRNRITALEATLARRAQSP
jgi:hypothetical protein